MTNPFNPLETELQHLEQWLKKDLDLLCQIEDRVRVTGNPMDRANLQLGYDQVRHDYEQHLARWETLRQQMGSTPSPTMQAVETQVQQNNAKMTEVAQQLNTPSAPAANTNAVSPPQPAPPANAPQSSASSSPPRVFVSYAHMNKRWFTALQTHLAPLVYGGKLNAWEDTQIPTGALWDAEIKKALDEADIAVLLVTPEFLASRYIVQNELPALLKGKKLVWIAVSACNYEVTDLAQYQCANDPARPLDSLPSAARNREWVNICQKILAVAVPPR